MFKKFLSTLFFMISASTAVAQNLIVAGPEMADLTPDQNDKLNLLQSLSTTESIKVIRVDPDQLKNNSSVSIMLNDDSAVSFSSNEEISTQDTRYVWTGETQTGLAMGGGVDGDATVSVNGDQLSAIIRTGDGIFRIQPLPGDLHALIKVDVSGLPPDHLEDESTSVNEQRDINDIDLRSDDDNTIAEIEVLVLFTPEAAKFSSDPLSLDATSVIEEANKSLINSEIRARFNLASADLIEYQESGSQDTDLQRLIALNDGYLDDAHTLRDKVSADIVILMVNNSDYCGQAGEIFSNAENAFATVYWQCAITNLSLAHEIGHLLGACHNPEVHNECSPFSYGHGFILPSEGVRTIMAYQCPQGNCTRVLQWSYPPAWGTPIKHNDARVLDQTSLRASRFR